MQGLRLTLETIFRSNLITGRLKSGLLNPNQMRYLIITKDNQPFYTNWFDYENLYNSEVMVCVFDIENGKHTFDGKNWEPTTFDHL